LRVFHSVKDYFAATVLRVSKYRLTETNFERLVVASWCSDIPEAATIYEYREQIMATMDERKLVETSTDDQASKIIF
jgi:hypothetical protein